MYYNTCVSSALTLKCKGSSSFSSFDNSYCFNNSFFRHPFAYSCCSCCSNNAANPMLYRMPIYPTSSQSTLIQCKKLILGDLDRYYSRFNAYRVGKECSYGKVCSFKGNGRRWGNGRYRCLVFEGMSEGSSGSEFNEAEVMLSLLSEDVDDELFDVRERNGRLFKRIDAEKRISGCGMSYVGKKKRDEWDYVGKKKRDELDYVGKKRRDEWDYVGTKKRDECDNVGMKKRDEWDCVDKKKRDEWDYVGKKKRDEWDYVGTKKRDESDYVCKKKRDESGAMGSTLKYMYEYEVIPSRKEEKRREEERASLLRRESQRTNPKEDERALLSRESYRDRTREEEREKLLRRENRGTRHTEEERASSLRMSQNERAREEGRESFSRREDHRQRLRKDGSSNSSYYSASSTNDLDYDSEMQIDEDEHFEEESSRKHGEYLRSKGVGVKERDRNYTSKQGVVSQKDDSAVGLYSATGDWRKKSEKRLTDISVEEIASRKESVQRQSRISQIHGSSSEQVSGSSTKYDDAKQESASITKFEGQTTGQHAQAGQFNTNIKYKQFVDTSESHGLRSKTDYSTRKSYHETDEISEEALSQIQQAREEYSKKIGSIIREDEYRRRSCRLNQESNIQKHDIRTESAIQGVSDTELRKKVLNEHHQSSQITELVELREKAEQLTKVDEKRTDVSPRKSETRMKNQEDYTNLVNKSSVESKEQSSQARIRDARSTKSVMESHEKKTLVGVSSTATAHSIDTSRVEVTQANKREVKASSQVVSGSSSIMESKAGFSTHVSDSGIQRDFSLQHKLTSDRPPQSQHKTHGEVRRDEVLGVSSDFTSHEDAIGSADRLQKSSTQYVGEFVENVRREVSNSEKLKEKKTSETKLINEGEQHTQKVVGQHGYGDSQSNEHESRQSTLISGPKGPSDEMWDVTEPSVKEPPETQVSEDSDKDKTAIVKRSGRSLWNIIGDIVHLRWRSHSDHDTLASKSGRRSSSNRSTSSETWFSGHEAEDNNSENAKNIRRLKRESASLDWNRQKMVRSHSPGETSSSSSSRDHMKHTLVETSSSPIVLQTSSPSKTIPLPSAEDAIGENLQGIYGAIVPEEGLPISSIPVRTSPVIEEIAEVGQAVPSSSSKGQAVSTVSGEVSGSKVKDAEMRRGKFHRTDQFVKDRFDEWEEAFKLESDQRNVDEIFMREALMEAKKAADNWEVPVGAVLVHDGRIVARGCNLVEELRDSTAHAEMLCIREASSTLRSWRLSDTTLYVTLEPCPMCAGAILQARIDTVVWGAPNKLLGADGSWIRLFPDGDGEKSLEPTDKPPAPVHPFHPNITIRRGVLASECAEAMQQFFQLRRKKKEKESDSAPSSCLPISRHHQPKFISKIHDVFHLMFCL